MKVVIIEDEQPIRETIEGIIRQYASFAEIIGTAENATEAHKLLVSSEPDVALCDINIGNDTIFDVLKQIENCSFKLIFITAFEEYALKAIKFSALDYLVKPVDPLELIDALNKANKFIDIDNERLKTQALVQNIETSSAKLERMVFKTSESIYLINISDILYIKADVSYSTVYLNDGRKIMVSRIIKEYDELLSDQGFLRVHQSSLVNIAAIDRYEKSEGGYLVLLNGHQVSVSVRKREQLFQMLKSI